MKKLVIFDLDGTLLNTLPTLAYYVNTALAEIGFDAIEEEKYKIFVGNGRDLLLHRALNYHGADTDENYIKVGKLFDAGYNSDVLYLTEPYDGISELLKKLKESGMTLAIMSNKPHEFTIPIAKKKFPKIFSEVWGKKKDFATKPNPAAALEICKNLNISPSDTVFIGDTSVDIETGKNGGFYTIGAEWGFRSRNELSEAGADFIASSPLDVLNAPIFK